MILINTLCLSDFISVFLSDFRFGFGSVFFGSVLSETVSVSVRFRFEKKYRFGPYMSGLPPLCLRPERASVRTQKISADFEEAQQKELCGTFIKMKQIFSDVVQQRE